MSITAMNITAINASVNITAFLRRSFAFRAMKSSISSFSRVAITLIKASYMPNLVRSIPRSSFSLGSSRIAGGKHSIDGSFA